MCSVKLVRAATNGLLCLLILLSPVKSQTALALDPERGLSEFGHIVWLTENGLPQNTVPSVAQTSDGYIWIATEEGLARFDGISFTVFDKQNVPELKSNNIRALYADSQGTLWISTSAGLVRLVNGTFSSFTAPTLPSNNIDLVFEDRAGSIWVATAAGLSRIKDGALMHFTTRDGLRSNSIQAICEDKEGALWIGTAGGLNRYQDGRFVSVPASEALDGKSIQAIKQDAAGQLWFGTSNGLVLLAAGRISTYSVHEGLPNERIISLLVDRESSLWVGTGSGLARWRAGRFSTSPNLAGSIVLALAEDREGSLWVGTESGGLHMLRDKKFTTFTTREGLPNDLVKAIYEDHAGNIWIGTYGGGLSRLKDGSFSSYTTSDGLSSNIVLSLYDDDQGNLWVGTPDGLNRFRNGKFTVITTAEGLANDFVRSIYADHHGNLWVGTRGGLTKLKDGIYTIYTTADGLPNDFVGTIYEDTRGNLWIGTLGGLSRFTDGKFTTYTTRDGLSSDIVTSLSEDSDGSLWIGTNGGGLDRLRDGKFVSYTTQNGLLDDVVYRILDDGQNNLWLSSNKGIFRVSKKDLEDFSSGRIATLTPTIYGPADGMITRECSGGGHPAGWRGHDGRLWFSTIRGVAMIDPAHIRINEQPPPVVIQQIHIDDQSIVPGRRIELPPGKARFEFSYAGLSYIAPEKVRFRYKLEGFDPDWVDGGTRRVAYYTNLPPGHYEFKVMARNNDGVWNLQGASFALYLQPHFYQTYWFYALCVLALALLIWQSYRLRVRQMARQFSAVLAERNRIAREIHDNLAQEILGISVQLELVARLMTVSTETARTHLDQARILVRNGIAEARRYVWDLRSQALENNDLPAALSETARRLTAETDVQAQVQVSGTFRPLTRLVESNLLRIGQEAINNAVRHAQAQRILINLKFDTRRVQLSVRDNGRGFDQQRTSGEGHFGLVGMRERAEQMGATLFIHSQPDEGTEVVVEVPVSG
jgi:ligand-binding sensor domain-containing protein/signal transduction histidine kinase